MIGRQPSAHQRSTRSLRLRACAALLGGACCARILAAEAQILLPGQYHGDEVTATSGQRWLGLFQPAGDSAQLVSVVLQVDAVLDEILDDDGVPTGKRIGHAGGPGTAVLLMKDVPGVGPGPARTIVSDVTLRPNEPVPLALEATHPYVMELECAAPAPSGSMQQAPCSLVLRAGGDVQVLGEYQALYQNGSFSGVGDDASLRVLWAGDLDGDSRLDLLVDLTDHYNVSLPTLFLSSAAPTGSLVTAVARHRSVGC